MAPAFNACAEPRAEWEVMLDELERGCASDSSAAASANIHELASTDKIATDPRTQPLCRASDRAVLTLVSDSARAASPSESSAAPESFPSVDDVQTDEGMAEPELAPAPKEEAYRFPTSERDDLAGLDHADLVNRLEHAVQARDPSGRPASYLQIREEVCALNTELNRRRMFAPRFRSNRMPPPLCKEREDIWLSRDRQVIDLHWLKCRGRKRRVDAPKYADMFGAELFDFDLASDFAMEDWYLRTKAETALHLTQRDQWELCSLQSKAHKDAWGGIRKERESIRTLLEESLHNRPHMQCYVDEWVLLWTAWRIVGNGPSELARCFALATGNPVRDTSGIRRRLQAVIKRINEQKRGKAT